MAIKVAASTVNGDQVSFDPAHSPAYARSLATNIARRLTPGAAALSLAFGAGVAQAATISVNSSSDADPSNTTDGQCTLREAIDAMNAGAATADCPNTGAGFGTADEILFDAALSGDTITLNGSQLPIITQALTITGPMAGDPSGITLDGDGLSRILNIEGAAANDFTVELNNLTLTGGHTTAVNEDGAAVRAFNADLKLNDSVVTGNSTTNDESDGGGLYVKNGDATLTGSTVSNNSTAGSGADGGGLFVAFGSATLTGSTVSGNSTAGDFAEGGGLFATNGASATLTNSTLSGNSTTGRRSDGGGLFVFGNDAILTSSTVSGNSATGVEADGGGLFVLSSDATLTNSTVSGNSTAGVDTRGGGLHINKYGDATLTHTTFADNSAAAGASGVQFGRTLTINNSLIAPAGGTACNDIAVGTNNLATDDSCGDEPNNADGSGVTVVSVTDINLGPLAFNGGPTQTHALLEGSVAINAAHDLECGSLSPLEDQRGVPRPASALGCDIGAYEVATDFEMGDAPDADPQDPEATPPASYPTLLANNGAAHMPVNGPILGALIDYETEGQPTADADGDDTNNLADEDGVFFTSDIEAGMDATVDVTVTNGPALLNAWADFNSDGDWDDSGEQIFTDEPLVDGSNAGLVFPVPEEVVSGETFARFRLSTATELTPEGMAVDGEVEDYKVAIAPPTVMFNEKKSDPKISESKGTFTINDALLLSNPSNQEVTVDVVFDTGASDAEIPADFDFSPTTVTFPPGETSANIEVTIVDDDVEEDEELAVFTLSNPTNATLGMPDTFQARLRDPGKGGGSSGSSCTLGRPGGPIDPTLPLLMLLAAGYLARKRHFD